MTKQINYCPYCGFEFEQTSERVGTRSASGYRCEDCAEVLELRVNRFPLA